MPDQTDQASPAYSGRHISGQGGVPQAATLLAFNKKRVQQEHDASDVYLEAIAVKIESLEATARMQIAAELAEAQSVFHYRRDTNGFSKLVEQRRSYSSDKAYDLIHVHKQFSGNLQKNFDTLGPSINFSTVSIAFPEKTYTTVAAKPTQDQQFVGEAQL